ncbi:MAG: N-acetyltransferase [Candidatus Aenigmarchaeota archaeon]|nr:N-acetyltransferase [Candidatus Aenigmarchaeota archaeon]
MKVPNDAGGVKQFQSELLYKIEKQPDAKGVNISIMDLYHTFTPKELRGRGLAEKLTKAAFEFAEKNKMKIRPSCSYVADVFLKKHPEWADMVE